MYGTRNINCLNLKFNGLAKVRFPRILNALVSIAIVMVALLILVSLGTLIGLIPAFKATSVKPIEALREE